MSTEDELHGGDGLPPKPERPLNSDCCGSDCTLCVFTLYEREMEQWQEQVGAILAARASNQQA